MLSLGTWVCMSPLVAYMELIATMCYDNFCILKWYSEWLTLVIEIMQYVKAEMTRCLGQDEWFGINLADIWKNTLSMCQECQIWEYLDEKLSFDIGWGLVGSVMIRCFKWKKLLKIFIQPTLAWRSYEFTAVRTYVRSDFSRNWVIGIIWFFAWG